MMKPQHSVLEISISERITEILETTGLTLTEFAIRCELNPSTLKNYRCTNSAITVESVSQICAAISVSLKDFFDFDVPLEIDPGITRLPREYTAVNEIIDDRRHRQKQERDCISHMISNTSYFDAPMELNHIIKIKKRTMHSSSTLQEYTNF